MSKRQIGALFWAALLCLPATCAAAGPDRGPAEFTLARQGSAWRYAPEPEPTPEPEPEAQQDEELEDRLREILGEEPEGEEEEEEEPTFSSPQRNLSDLNPEISILGDFWGLLTNEQDLEDTHDHEGEEHDHEEAIEDHEGEEPEEGHAHAHDDYKSGFRLNEVEIAFQAPLDPFSRAKFYLGIHDEDLHIEEAYVEWTNLFSGRFQLKAGKFFANFGQLNRWHPHAWPTAGSLPALGNLFGGENLAGIGGSLTWLMPPVLGDYNELVFEVFNGDNERAFAGELWKHPVGLVRFKSYNDLSPSTYLEIGFSGAAGENDPDAGHMTWLQGLDFSLVWSPPERSLYRGIETRTELFFSQRDTEAGRRDAFNLFSFTEVKLARRWSAGGRLDYVQDLVEDHDASYGGAGFLTFWQSEFVRVRFQYEGLNLEGAQWRHRTILQVTFALGPHKHERY